MIGYFKSLLTVAVASVSLAFSAAAAQESASVRIHQNESDQAVSAFTFEEIPSPAVNDAAAAGTWVLVDGELDRNSGGLATLKDGKLPGEEDEPQRNCFFRAGSRGGRLMLDLGRVVSVGEVRSYSWHPGSRGPQVYALYGLESSASEADLSPKQGTDPVSCGWRLVAKVDTRPKGDEVGGQYAVSVAAPTGKLGSFRYLLFDVLPTREGDNFAQTFFSEIDVIDAETKMPLQSIATKSSTESYRTKDGAIQFVLDVSDTPDLADWARTNVIPMALDWYPKLVKLLPSEGFSAPKKVTIVFSSTMEGVADTAGTRVRCAGKWFGDNLKGEALGAVFHELVHVTQQYGRVRNPNPVPGWFVEGMADYLRWYLFEPDSRGAEISPRNIPRARYDGSYRISANFLNWVTETYQPELVTKINAAIREGRYSKDLWKTLAGHSLEELGSEWHSSLEKKAAKQNSGS